MTLVQFFNQNSFLLIAGLILTIIAIALRALHVRRVFWLVWGVALIVSVVILLNGRTVSDRPFASVGEIEQVISGGRPTLVEFFSNY